MDRKWVRCKADELAIEAGHWFDEAAGERACDFLERFCRQSKGRWRGQPLVLLPWQRDLVMRIFGWKKPDGFRRYRRVYIELPKKNGKSTLISAIALLLLVADGEGSPEVYLNATDTKQASIVYDEARKMVRDSPGLSARLEIKEYAKRIIDAANDGAIITNSGDAGGNKDGFNPHGAIFDELHLQKMDRRVWRVFQYAAISREQPLTIAITTAGASAEGIWFELRTFSEALNTNTMPDPVLDHLGVVYRADDKADIDDPAVWAACNPSLGHTMTIEGFRADLAIAKKDPVDLADFKRYRLGIVGGEAQKYFDLAIWDGCKSSVKRLEALRDQPAWCGLDLSTVNDLSALAILTGNEGDGFELLMRYWLPEDNIDELSRKHRVPYRVWVDRELITLTPGNVIDYSFIESELKALALILDVRKLFADRYNATQLCLNLRDQDGIKVEFLRQGFISLSPPTKEFSRLLQGRMIRHGGCPVLRWMASNAVSDRDAAGNVKLHKGRSAGKIDGVAAAVNAIAAMSSDDALLSDEQYQAVFI